MQQQHAIFYILRMSMLDIDRNGQSKENSVIIQVLWKEAQNTSEQCKQ